MSNQNESSACSTERGIANKVDSKSTLLFRLKDLFFTARKIGMKLTIQHSTFEVSLLITTESNSGAFSPCEALALFRTKKAKFARKIYFHETHTNAGRV